MATPLYATGSSKGLAAGTSKKLLLCVRCAAVMASAVNQPDPPEAGGEGTQGAASEPWSVRLAKASVFSTTLYFIYVGITGPIESRGWCIYVCCLVVLGLLGGMITDNSTWRFLAWLLLPEDVFEKVQERGLLSGASRDSRGKQAVLCDWMPYVHACCACCLRMPAHLLHQGEDPRDCALRLQVSCFPMSGALPSSASPGGAAMSQVPACC